jgi:hypothetical protein
VGGTASPVKDRERDMAVGNGRALTKLGSVCAENAWTMTGGGFIGTEGEAGGPVPGVDAPEPAIKAWTPGTESAGMVAHRVSGPQEREGEMPRREC